MTIDDINEIKDLLNDESDKWRLDVGDWMGYVEELVEEVERLHAELERVNSGLRKAIVENHECVFSADMEGKCFVCGAKV